MGSNGSEVPPLVPVSQFEGFLRRMESDQRRVWLANHAHQVVHGPGSSQAHALIALKAATGCWTQRELYWTRTVREALSGNIRMITRTVGDEERTFVGVTVPELGVNHTNPVTSQQDLVIFFPLNGTVSQSNPDPRKWEKIYVKDDEGVRSIAITGPPPSDGPGTGFARLIDPPDQPPPPYNQAGPRQGNSHRQPGDTQGETGRRQAQQGQNNGGWNNRTTASRQASSSGSQASTPANNPEGQFDWGPIIANMNGSQGNAPAGSNRRNANASSSSSSSTSASGSGSLPFLSWSNAYD